MKITHIQTEYLTNPLGLGVQHPTITWNVEGEDIVSQKGFEVSFSLRNGEERRIQKETPSMHYEFEEGFASRDFVSYRLRIQNEAGSWSPWSELQHFSIGLLHHSDWKAKWIRGDYSVSKKKRYPVDCFRKEFEVKDPSRGFLYLTALGIYEASINGKKVGNAILTPGSTDPRKRVTCDTYDVSSLLKKGKNEITILLSDGWYRGSIGAKGFTYVFGKFTQVMAELDTDGGTIVTDETWKWSNDGPIRFADLKDGEIVDFNLTPSFSHKVRVGSYDHVISSSNASKVVAIGREKAVRSFVSESGKTVYEFENNVAGNLYLRLKGKKDSKIHLVLGEKLDEHQDVTLDNVQCVHKGKKTPLQEIDITLKEGVNEYETKFFYGGFRYAGVLANDGVEILDIEQIAISSEMDEISQFECSNPLINIFYENTIRSCRSNFVDIPTDCPTRERMGWMGDSQIIFNTAAYLFDAHAFFRKHVRDIYDRQDKNGRLPQIAPYSAEDWFMDVMNGSVGWADAGVLIPYRMYLQYGDRKILEDNYDDMARYAKFMIRRCGPAKGIYSLYAKPLHLSKENRKFGVNTGQSYGEWAEPSDVKSFVWTDFAEPHPEENMAYTSYVLSLMVKIAKLLKKEEDIPLFETYRDGVKRAYQELVTKPRFSLDTDRQCKQVRPLYFDLLRDDQKEFAKKRLVQALDHYGWRLGTGFLSTPFILDVLADIDPEFAYRLLENEKMPGWLFMAKENTGTIWEGWEGPKAQIGISSLNHYSKGAMVEWLFSGMLGIRVQGENHFAIRPVVGGNLTFAKGGFRSIYGEIRSSWEKKGNHVVYRFEIPTNCTADLALGDKTYPLGPGTHEFTL